MLMLANTLNFESHTSECSYRKKVCNQCFGNTSQRQLQEWNKKCSIWKIQVTMATPPKIILILFNASLKILQFLYKTSRKCTFYEIFNRCRTFGTHCIICTYIHTRACMCVCVFIFFYLFIRVRLIVWQNYRWWNDVNLWKLYYFINKRLMLFVFDKFYSCWNRVIQWIVTIVLFL